MKVLYNSVITSIGPGVEELLQGKICILFADSAPADLKEISVSHTHEKPPWFNFRPQDIISIGGQHLEILAIGNVAMKTFKELGHFSLKIRQPSNLDNMLPGDVLVATNNDLKLETGMEIKVVRY